MTDEPQGPARSGMRLGPTVRELVILVAGILIAFGLESWRSGRVERAEVRAELRSVQIELDENLGTLDDYLEWHRRSLRATEDLIARLAEGEDAVAPDSILWGVVFTPTYDPRRGALDALINSGRLALVEDQELRRDLAAHSGSLQDARDEETRARSYVDLQLGSILNRSGNMARPQSVNWRDGPTTEEQRGRTTRIRFSQELANHLQRRRLFAILCIESLGDVRESIEALSDDIDAALGR